MQLAERYTAKWLQSAVSFVDFGGGRFPQAA